MDTKLKTILKNNVKDMYRSLTMLDAALLVNSAERFHEELKALKEKAAECEMAMLKNKAD